MLSLITVKSNQFKMIIGIKNVHINATILNVLQNRAITKQE